MTDKVRRVFGITENGAKGLIRASIASFFKQFAYMLPATFILLFSQELYYNELKTPIYYIVAILALAGVMFFILNIDYITNYNETYKESANLRIEIADTLKELPLSYFNKHDLSDLAQTIMRDVAEIERAMSHAIPQFIGFIFFFTLIAILLLIGNVKLALCILLPILLTAVMLGLSRNMQRKAFKKHFDLLRENADSFQEAIELQQEIKSYGKEDAVKEELYRRIERNEAIQMESEMYVAIPVTTISAMLKFAVGCTIVVGVWLLARKEVSLLYFLGYLLASSRIADALSAVYLNLTEMLMVESRVDRLNELRETPKQKGERTELQGYSVELRNIKFSYDGSRNVIDGISFVAGQNEVTALVGPSGCGKTSVLRLISRLYDYDEGELLLDGKEISRIDTDQLFEKISIVFQDVTLFGSSVMENIRIGNKNATDEEVIEAARLANCHEFVEKLPNGYHTLIGENGSKLSGGERQRISIARAFLKNAPIILLDEISASLDVENEMKIQESLNSLIKDKTVIIVSHRLKSIENADRIVVMNAGRIDSIGTHKELIKRSELYNSMLRKSQWTAEYRY